MFSRHPHNFLFSLSLSFPEFPQEYLHLFPRNARELLIIFQYDVAQSTERQQETSGLLAPQRRN